MGEEKIFKLSEDMELKTRKADYRGRVAIGPEYGGKEVTMLIINSRDASRG